MKKFLFVSIALAVIKSANAQYTFQSITVAGSGPSAKATTILTWGPFQTLKECENARIRAESANTWSESILGGRIEAKTKAGPCSPPGGSSIGSPDVYGISKGTSFYSTNAANEIQNWSEDNTERMLALNPDYESKEPEIVTTEDPSFNNIIENIPYSDEAFSGRMPAGSFKYIKNTDNSSLNGSGIDSGKPFVPLNMREDGSYIIHSSDFDMKKIDLKPVKPIIGVKDEKKISDFWFDLAGDVAKTAKDVYDISKVIAGTAATTTATVAIGTAILADVAINLVVEDAKAYYKVYKGENVTTGDIFKNTLEKSSLGLFKIEKSAGGYTKGVIDTAANGVVNHYIEEGTLTVVGATPIQKGLTGPGISIATRAAKYGNMIVDKLNESE